MSEAFNVEVKDGKANLSVDPNKNGVPVLKLSMDLSEAAQEVFLRGDSIEGAKIVGAELVGSNVVLELDTDKDGETSVKVEIPLTEVFSEISSAIIK